MNLELVNTDSQNQITNRDTELEIEFLTMSIGDQIFGIPVESVRDVLVLNEVASVPLVPEQVIGLINLRGRIVTALDIRAILNIKDEYNLENSMNVVVEYHNELYSLVVDSVGDVIKLHLTDIIENPENLSKNWLDVSLGIYPIENKLIVIVDINKLLKSLDSDND